MHIGICTQYRALSPAYAAIQLAELLSAQGHDVSMHSPPPVQARLHPHWDRRLTCGRDFTGWARPLDAVIWTYCPGREPVIWAGKRTKDRRRLTVLIPCWAASEAALEHAYPCFRRLVAPSQTLGEYLRDELKLAHVTLAPWSPCLPVTAKPAPAGPLSVHIPLAERADTACGDDQALALVDAVLERKDIRLMVSASNRNPALLRRLEHRALDTRLLEVARAGGFEDQLLRYANHDLTVVLRQIDAFGMTALLSLHMGTPIVGFDLPPVDEFVDHDRNGVLVGCAATEALPHRHPLAAEDYTRFQRALFDILDHPDRIRRLQEETAAGLARRRTKFEQTWKHLLSEL